MELMEQHHWPGNVREMENLLYRMAALTSEEVISAAMLREQLRTSGLPAKAETGGGGVAFQEDFQETILRLLSQYFAAHVPALPPPGVHERVVRLAEKPLIMLALRATGGNQIHASELLGINRNTLRKKIRDLEITLEKTVLGKNA
jgi:two-component system nitrogen regulation response regulator GlnG